MIGTLTFFNSIVSRNGRLVLADSTGSYDIEIYGVDACHLNQTCAIRNFNVILRKVTLPNNGSSYITSSDGSCDMYHCLSCSIKDVSFLSRFKREDQEHNVNLTHFVQDQFGQQRKGPGSVGEITTLFLLVRNNHNNFPLLHLYLLLLVFTGGRTQ